MFLSNQSQIIADINCYVVKNLEKLNNKISKKEQQRKNGTACALYSSCSTPTQPPHTYTHTHTNPQQNIHHHSASFSNPDIFVNGHYCTRAGVLPGCLGFTWPKNTQAHLRFIGRLKRTRNENLRELASSLKTDAKCQSKVNLASLLQ